MIKHGEPPYLECSSRGEKRLSAFHARVKARDGKTIEAIYQAAKVFADGSTGKMWQDAKGKEPVNKEECHQLYAQLWDEYMAENPPLVEMIVRASGLSDMFGQEGHACQATELWRIRSQRIRPWSSSAKR